VVSQATDTEARCDKLLAFYRDFHKPLQKGSVRLSGIVDGLFQSPVVSVLSIKNKFKVTRPTAHADLKKLQALGVVQEMKESELITFYCPQIYDVTNEDGV
jgi:Fic family protein